MADENIKQVMLDAIADADSLERFINGSDSETVLTRLSAEYPTMQKAIKELFENGGLPATPFATKVLMTASALTDGKYALVTDDTNTENIGLWVKTDGEWYKSKYGDNSGVIYGDEVDLTSLPVVNIGVLSDMALKVSTELGLSWSPIIPTTGDEYYSYELDVNEGELYEITATNTYQCFIGFAITGGSTIEARPLVRGEGLEVIASKNTSLIQIPVGVDKIYISQVYRGVDRTPEKVTRVESVSLTSSDINAGGAVGYAKYGVASAGYLADVYDSINRAAASPIAEINKEILDVGILLKNGTPEWSELAQYSKSSYVISLQSKNPIYVTSPPHIVSQVALIRRDDPMTEGTLLPEDSIFHNIGAGETLVLEPNDYVDALWVSIHFSGANREPESILQTYDFGVANALNQLKLQSHEKNVTSVINLPEIRSTVFATDKNYILKNEIVNGVDTILTSNNLGKTWSSAENIAGDIVSYHIFSDGTILLCSRTKAYTLSGDYSQMIESAVYDHDGSVYVPEALQFFIQQNGNPLMYVGDTEMWVWGDYKLRGTPRIWYTTDSGRTIKCAVKFGTTEIDGKARRTRHVHAVTQRRKDERFYVTTGDAGDECFIMSMGYDVESDSWDFKFYSSGDLYKFGDIYFDDFYAYLLTDYTLAAHKPFTGVYRVPVSGLGDISKYQAIYQPTVAELGSAAFSRFIMDSNGNKVIFPDFAGTGYAWIATEGTDFKKVAFNPSRGLSYRLGTNYNGDCYVVTFNNRNEYLDESQLKLNRGSYNITPILRDYGVTDFFKGGRWFEGTWVTN